MYTLRTSSPENPLIVAEAMDFPLGTHFIRAPDPRVAKLLSFRWETGDPDVGRSVVVEMKVMAGEPPFYSRWAFRYLWAQWSLIADFGEKEQWKLVVEKVGPRTEMQVRGLYELAEKLHFNAVAEPLKRKWSQVKLEVLPRDWRKAELGTTTAEQKKIEEQEDRAILELQLLAAKADRGRRKRADSETTILQAFLQGRTSAQVLCKLFDLDWRLCAPVLVGLHDAYERLISEALGRRCRAVLTAQKGKRITLQEAADILNLDTPEAEDILRLGSIRERKFNPATMPSKKQLLAAIQDLENLKLAWSHAGHDTHESHHRV